MKPIFGKEFSQHLKEVIDIDSVTLPAEYVTSLEKLEERFHTFEDSFVGMLDDSGRLVGYINYFPLQETTRERLVQGDIPNDIFLGEADIHHTFPDQPFDAYIITVAVLPEFQNGLVVRSLVLQFYVRMRAWAEASTHFRGIYASAVADDGRRFLLRLGMRPLPQNQGLFYATIDQFFKAFDDAE